MIDLLTEIKTRIETLLAPELFDDPTGGQSIPMVKLGGLDPKRSGDHNEEDFPFVVIRPLTGSDDPREERINVQIIGGIYNNDNILAGLISIDRLNGLLLTINNTRNFSPYRLSLPITWKLGDDDGLQPHPYYHTTISLSFIRTGNCN